MYIFTPQFAPLLAKRAAPSLMTSSRPCPVSYGVKDSDGSYCALLCMTNSTIYYWESQGNLNQGDEPCVAKITAFDEKYTVEPPNKGHNRKKPLYKGPTGPKISHYYYNNTFLTSEERTTSFVKD